jgi:O-acetyl-ADP-ribose deacetylase (regulator of RNase III)
MQRFALTGSAGLLVEEGDLTRADVDAIVNAANERMLGGGGVDGAIHRAAGPELLAACREHPEVRPDVRCPTGEARITPGFRLPARHVIHTVGPWYSSSKKSAPLLASAYRSSLELANAHGLKSIAFPAISCGVYRYPVEEAAPLAIATCRDHAGELEEVRFVLFGEAMYRAWLDAAHAVLGDKP